MGECLPSQSDYGPAQATPHRVSRASPPLTATNSPFSSLPRVYLKLVVAAQTSWLEERLHLDGEEVEAAVWLTPVLARLVAEAEVPTNCPRELEVTLLDTTGLQRKVNINCEVLTNKVSHQISPDETDSVPLFQAPDQGADIERVSTGTRYALSQWLQSSQSSQPSQT